LEFNLAIWLFSDDTVFLDGSRTMLTIEDVTFIASKIRNIL